MFYICYKVRGWRSLSYWMIHVQGLMLCCLLASSLHNSFSSNSSPGSSFPTFFQILCYLYVLISDSERALELFLSYLDRMHWFEQWFSHLAVHGSWCLGPTPRDVDLMGMGCKLGHWVNLTHSEVSELLLDMTLSWAAEHCATWVRVSSRHLLAWRESHWPCPLPRSTTPTRWLRAVSCCWVPPLPWNLNVTAEKWEPRMTTQGLSPSG